MEAGGVIDFYAFLMSAVLAALVLFLLAPRSRWWRLAATPLGMLALGFALRFCGRTYPGIYFPDSPFLNDLLNGSGLFTGVGYLLVFVLGVSDLVFVFLTLFRTQATAHSATKPLVALRVVLLFLTLAIIAYGFFHAVILYEHWNH